MMMIGWWWVRIIIYRNDNNNIANIYTYEFDESNSDAII